VYGVTALEERSAALLFEIWPNEGEPHEFLGQPLTRQGNVAVADYDLDGGAPELRALVRGDDVTALELRRNGDTILVAGWYRGVLGKSTELSGGFASPAALRASPDLSACGAFAALIGPTAHLETRDEPAPTSAPPRPSAP
jgi:hypothetical protein